MRGAPSGCPNAPERQLVLTSLKATTTGERLDRFELVAEIASGGMATVFLARLEGVAGFQRLCAIKRLHPHLANEAEFVDMFLDEARLAARIHHPNVVSILEVGTSAQGYYLVMEYIEGDTAARLLARAAQTGARLPTGIALRIALDTLVGLHAAHDLTDDDGQPLHIVHRDVSPQNVLIGVDGVSRITDFGVAHAATRLSTTRTGQLKGKLAYMAPEQARGAVVDRKSDVFAMGVVLWELLAGKRLFKANNDAETLHRILFAPLPTLRGEGIDIPIPLEAVCMRALAREPADRYASAADFADELERVGRSLSVLATTREVASYVDGSIGAEISQQREVVRGWLSRSEPSRNDRINVPLGPTSEGALKAQGALARSGSNPRRPSLRDVSALAGGGPPSSDPVLAASKRAEVSSVSSAVLQVAEAAASDAMLASASGEWARVNAPQRKRARLMWTAVAASACFVLAVGIGFAIPRSSDTPSPLPQLAASGPPAAPSAAPVSAAPTPELPVAAVPASPPAASSADAAARSPHAGPTNGPPPTRSARPPARGGRPSRGAPSDDDDLSRNPYR